MGKPIECDPTKPNSQKRYRTAQYKAADIIRLDVLIQNSLSALLRLQHISFFRGSSFGVTIPWAVDGSMGFCWFVIFVRGKHITRPLPIFDSRINFRLDHTPWENNLAELRHIDDVPIWLNFGYQLKTSPSILRSDRDIKLARSRQNERYHCPNQTQHNSNSFIA